MEGDIRSEHRNKFWESRVCCRKVEFAISDTLTSQREERRK